MAAPVVAAAIARQIAIETAANHVGRIKLAKRPRVVHWVPEYTAELSKEFERRTRRAAEVIRDRIRKNIGKAWGGRPSKPGEYPKKRTGRLVKGVRTRMGRRSPFTFTVYSTVPYGDFLEYDTKGGKTIIPRTKKALAWTEGRGKGKRVVFAKRVKQGRITGRAWMRRTLAECRKVIAAIYTRGIKVKDKGTLRIG